MLLCLEPEQDVPDGVASEAELQRPLRPGWAPGWLSELMNCLEDKGLQPKAQSRETAGLSSCRW